MLRAAIFLPAVVSLAVAAIPFRLMFTPSIGLITYWLGAIGVHSTDEIGQVAPKEAHRLTRLHHQERGDGNQRQWAGLHLPDH